MSDPISVDRVSFASDGDKLVASLYRPSLTGREDPRFPAVLVTGSWTTVKEQMAGRYARGIAERGYLALAFDFRGYGESGGQPQDYESPQRKIRDIYNAISYLGARPDVDHNRIAALGVCASAGYMTVNAAQDRRVRSVGLVAPWLHNAELVKLVYGGADGVEERIAAGNAAWRKYQVTDQVDYVPAVSTTDPAAAMYGPFDYYLDRNRGATNAWRNRFAVMAWPEWLLFDPIAVAPRITVPTMLVHSEDAAIPEGARSFYEALSAPKNIHWLSGTQFDFYDQEPAVSNALDLIDKHFRATL